MKCGERAAIPEIGKNGASARDFRILPHALHPAREIGPKVTKRSQSTERRADSTVQKAAEPEHEAQTRSQTRSGNKPSRNKERPVQKTTGEENDHGASGAMW
jgi:hypothetical protein